MEIITAEISMKFADSNASDFYFNSLFPETLNIATNRSKIVIQKEKDHILFKIDAKDITAFRATVNSYLIWMRVLQSISTLFEV